MIIVVEVEERVTERIIVMSGIERSENPGRAGFSDTGEKGHEKYGKWGNGTLCHR